MPVGIFQREVYHSLFSQKVPSQLFHKILNTAPYQTQTLQTKSHYTDSKKNYFKLGCCLGNFLNKFKKYISARHAAGCNNNYFKARNFRGMKLSRLRSEICEIKIPPKTLFWLNRKIKVPQNKFPQKVQKSVEEVLEKYRCYGIENIFISGLLPTTHITEDVIGKVNDLTKDICKVERCFYVSNDNITHANIFKDGLHLLDNDKQISADSFIFHVNRNFSIPRTFHPNVHLTAA